MTEVPKNTTDALALGIVLIHNAPSKMHAELAMSLILDLLSVMSRKEIESARVLAAATIASQGGNDE
tara:strand:+ start:3036 stop:3236 length:201 start_codon:yes stop_codon:yes gene_type:complete